MIKKIKKFITPAAVSNAISLCIAILFFMLCSNIAPIKDIIGKVISTLSPFIYAFMLAFILAKPVELFEVKVYKSSNPKRDRTLAVITVMALLVFILYCLFTLILPQVGKSLYSIVDAAPDFSRNLYSAIVEFMNENNVDGKMSEQLTNLWNTYSEQVIGFISAAIPSLLTFTINIGSSAIKTVMVVIITIYMLIEKKTLCFQIKRITYSLFTLPVADRICEVTRRSDRIFTEFLTSKALDSLIIGVITFVAMMFISTDYSMLIAIIIGITNMVPVFGPFIGAVPAVLIMLMISPAKAVEMGVFILILQQIDGNIIGPKIMGNSLGLSALWILFAITIGSKLMGFAGMLLGVPAFAVIYSIAAENMDRILREKQIVVNREDFTLDTTNYKEKD